jgi:type VI secretion system lysozyme-like protein
LLFEQFGEEQAAAPVGLARKWALPAALIASVRTELMQLLNTRCPVRAEHLGDRQRTVIDYGVLDMSGFCSQSEENCNRIASSLAEAITCYEPRLKDIRVRVWPDPNGRLDLHGEIRAVVVDGAQRAAVSFPIRVQDAGREVHIGRDVGR